LAGKTEFWRAHRQYAGILHFVYLTCSYPGVYTADHFRDVVNLKLDPYFSDYVGEAFKPLGVYLNFWHTDLRAGSEQEFRIMLVNDEAQSRKGSLALVLEDAGGHELSRVSTGFELAALGQMSYRLRLAIPAGAEGKCLLRARAVPEGTDSTTSRRKVTVIAPK